ncbi:MAG: uroporphyrinogen-III synthase [Bacteroidales bacterium]
MTQTIITTGSIDSSLSLASELAKKGKQVYSLPMIKISPVADKHDIQHTCNTIETYDWIIFTSKHGVSYFFDELYTYTHSYKIPKHIHIACIGNKTAIQLDAYSHSADYISQSNNGLDFAREIQTRISKHSPNHVSLLFPTGNLTDNKIAQHIPAHASIKQLIVYNTIRPQTYNKKIVSLIADNAYDYIIFTSSSGVQHFVELCAESIKIAGIKALSIGPSTTKTLKEAGVQSITQAQEYTIEGIVKQIAP